MTMNAESPPDAVLERMMAALDASPETGRLSTTFSERASQDSQPDFTPGALPALLSMNGVWYQVKNSAQHDAPDTDLSISAAHRFTGSVSSGLDSLQEINCSRPELVARLQRQKSTTARPDAVRKPAYVRVRDQGRGGNGQAESAVPYSRLRKFGSRLFGKFMGTSTSPAQKEKQPDQTTRTDVRSSPIASPPKTPSMGETGGCGNHSEPEEEPKHEVTPLATKIQRSRSVNREPPRRKPVPPEVPQCTLPVRSELPGIPCLAPVASADTTMDTSTVMEGSALSVEDSIIGKDQAAVGIAPAYPLQPPPRPPRSALRPLAQKVPDPVPNKRTSFSDGPPSPVPTLSHGGSDADDESSYSEQDAASPPTRALVLDAVPRSEECNGLAIGIPKTQYTVPQCRFPVVRAHAFSAEFPHTPVRHQAVIVCERAPLYTSTQYWTQASDVQGSFDRQRSDLIKLAADGSVEYLPVPEPQEPLAPQYEAAGDQSSTPRVYAQEPAHENMALTADNLHQIPDAEQLAPGIRLPENVVSDSANVMMPAPAESGLPMEPALPMAAVPDTNIPAELDPRTEAFRPGVPRAGSVFSVAVQPGSPKVDKVPPQMIESPTPDSSVSSRAATPTFSMGPTGSSQSKLRSNTDTSTVSFAPSEAGSTASDMSSSNYSTDVHEQELAIDRQRMLERAMSGGELGIGGPIPAPFMRTRDDPISMGIQAPPRTNSAAATVASSPTTSTRGSGSISASRESSRRGSIDSAEFSVPRDAVAP